MDGSPAAPPSARNGCEDEELARVRPDHRREAAGEPARERLVLQMRRIINHKLA